MDALNWAVVSNWFKAKNWLATKKKGATMFEYVMIGGLVITIIVVLFAIVRPALETWANNAAKQITDTGGR